MRIHTSHHKLPPPPPKKMKRTEVIQKYQQLKKANLGVVVATLIKEGDAKNQIEALKIIDAFLQWMAMSQFIDEGKILVMFDRKIDKAFHAFVLNTRFYAQFCQDHFKAFLHHDPLDVQTTPVEDVERGIEYTMKAFEDVYGTDLHPTIAKYVRQHKSRGLSVKAITCLSRNCADYASKQTATFA